MAKRNQAYAWRTAELKRVLGEAEYNRINQEFNRLLRLNHSEKQQRRQEFVARARARYQNLSPEDLLTTLLRDDEG